MLESFANTNHPASSKLNALVREVNSLNGYRGDSYTGVVRGPGGAMSTTNVGQILARMPRHVPINDVQTVGCASTVQQDLTGVTVIDGVTMGDGCFVFLQNQTDPTENGVYTYDLATNTLNGFMQPDGVLVADGTANGQTLWVLSEVDVNKYYEVSPPPNNIEIELDGGGAAITSSLAVAGRFERVPYGCTILGWRVMSDVSGSIAVDIARNGTSIVGSGTKPALSSSADSGNQVPTGWATGGTVLAEDDILTYSIYGTPATLTYAKVILWVK